ncbi:magnesium transporter CorA family protein [Candidatus Gottesmanbacteria bacterium]|nr:magnesium transporter CorA family protein [Candidatus Gottesmanbacteria bacterium]
MKHTGGIFNFLFPRKNGANGLSDVIKKNADQSGSKEHFQQISIQKTKLTVIRQPKEEHVEFLRDNYHIHPIHQEDVLSAVQRPKIDFEDNYIFFVLHFPWFNETTQRIESREIDFFFLKTDLVIIINDDYPPLEEILDVILHESTVKDRYFAKGAGFLLYRIIDNLVDTIFPLVEQIERSLEQIDKDVFTKTARHVVKKISFLRRNVIYFQTMVKPEMNSFRAMEEKPHPLINKELKTYFSNVTDHFKKLFDRLEDAKELTDNLSLTFENYLSFRTNETIKYLTVFSAILMPLTLLTGVYGMNLRFLPLASDPKAIFLFMGISFVIVVSMLSYFRFKHLI